MLIFSYAERIEDDCNGAISKIACSCKNISIQELRFRSPPIGFFKLKCLGKDRAKNFWFISILKQYIKSLGASKDRTTDFELTFFSINGAFAPVLSLQRLIPSVYGKKRKFAPNIRKHTSCKWNFEFILKIF